MANQSSGSTTEGNAFDAVRYMYFASAGLTVIVLAVDMIKNTDPKSSYWFKKVKAARKYTGLRLKNNRSLRKLFLRATPHEIVLANIRNKIAEGNNGPSGKRSGGGIVSWIKSAFQPKSGLIDDLAYATVRVSGYIYASMLAAAFFLALVAWQGILAARILQESLIRRQTLKIIKQKFNGRSISNPGSTHCSSSPQSHRARASFAIAAAHRLLNFTTVLPTPRLQHHHRDIYCFNLLFLFLKRPAWIPQARITHTAWRRKARKSIRAMVPSQPTISWELL